MTAGQSGTVPPVGRMHPVLRVVQENGSEAAVAPSRDYGVCCGGKGRDVAGDSSSFGRCAGGTGHAWLNAGPVWKVWIGSDCVRWQEKAVAVKKSLSRSE